MADLLLKAGGVFVHPALIHWDFNMDLLARWGEYCPGDSASLCGPLHAGMQVVAVCKDRWGWEQAAEAGIGAQFCASPTWVVCCQLAGEFYDPSCHPLFMPNKLFTQDGGFAGVRMGIIGKATRDNVLQRLRSKVARKQTPSSASSPATDYNRVMALHALDTARVPRVRRPEFQELVKRRLETLAEPGDSPPMVNPPALLWCGSEGASGISRLTPFALDAGRTDFPLLSYQWMVDSYQQGRAMPFEPYLLRLVEDPTNRECIYESRWSQGRTGGAEVAPGNCNTPAYRLRKARGRKRIARG
eukprot:GHVT01059526.1.p1 GENE.GHVT01059526.1~~GHVT01059526.1.p1  ORF type:complete len:350 (+),score=52.28 GHVT01059526.1:150-1052(+)